MHKHRRHDYPARNSTAVYPPKREMATSPSKEIPVDVWPPDKNQAALHRCIVSPPEKQSTFFNNRKQDLGISIFLSNIAIKIFFTRP